MVAYPTTMIVDQLAYSYPIVAPKVFQIPFKAALAPVPYANLSHMAYADYFATVMDAGEYLLQFRHSKILRLVDYDDLVLEVDTP